MTTTHAIPPEIQALYQTYLSAHSEAQSALGSVWRNGCEHGATDIALKAASIEAVKRYRQAFDTFARARHRHERPDLYAGPRPICASGGR